MFLALLGGQEWLLIALLVVVLIFGASRIPQIARALGRSKAEFKAGAADGADSDADTLAKARALGIPTDGRSIADVRADVERRPNP